MKGYLKDRGDGVLDRTKPNEIDISSYYVAYKDMDSETKLYRAEFGERFVEQWREIDNADFISICSEKKNIPEYIFTVDNEVARLAGIFYDYDDPKKIWAVSYDMITLTGSHTIEHRTYKISASEITTLSRYIETNY